MVETSDVDMSGKVTLEPATTDSSRTAGKLFAVAFDANFELKTPLRNWSFSADIQIKPFFYNDPVAGGSGKTDLYFGFFPYITMDMIPNLQLLFEGSFDSIHNYIANFYDLQGGDNDYLDIGPLITVNSHINTNIALRFYTDNFSFNAAGIYANIGVAL